MNEPFPEIRFLGKLRPSQRDVESIAEAQLSAGQRRLHIVAPPGSGKTIVGLYLWACHVRRPALVLSPNSAIQAQWAARTSLFARPSGLSLDELVSTSPKKPRLLTSLTYQSITLPARASEPQEKRAIDLWVQSILENEEAESTTAAEIWVNDLRTHNPDYFQKRLAYYRKRIRDDDSTGGKALSTLHDSCIDTLGRLRSADVGLLILDECHHLMGHWGRVLSEVSEYMGDPVVIGLTATPPDREGRAPEDVERYDEFFGEIDYQVPVPAVVKDGFLAPYQDLAYFVRPTDHELTFVARVDHQFQALVDELCRSKNATTPEAMAEDPHETLTDWLCRVLRDKQLPDGRASSWRAFHARDSKFAEAAAWFVRKRGLPTPSDVPALAERPEEDETEALVTLIDRYTRHHLRPSRRSEDHRLADTAVARLRMLGVQITDSGPRPCASPVSRVIAYTRNKTDALVPILSTEHELLGDEIRAVVIADFEKTSATTAEISHLLDEEAGGAIAAFRRLLDDRATNRLDPILVTGSTVLVDADLIVRFMTEAKLWLRKKSKRVELSHQPQGTFCVVTGSGGDWSPRVYVEMITELFQRGVSRCLVGTRGLLGEGWDANRINVLVDLSTATTSMTVNQLRGRSIRLDPNDPKKLANNWDVVCVAPEFNKGLDDYRRFKRKHRSVFGVCDDGAIEKGVGHVHAAFTDLQPELIDGNVAAINRDMLLRAGRRSHVYHQWEIGKPYSSEPIRAVEVRGGRGGGGGFPPFSKSSEPWTANSLALAIGQAVLGAMCELAQIDELPPLRVTDRDGGYVRVFLENASQKDSARFAHAMAEAVGPLDRPRYVIPRFIDHLSESFLRRLLPQVISQFFQRRDRRMVMLHAVPSELATKRSVVDVYQRHWNLHVSPGEAVYARNAKGQELIQQAFNDGNLPRSTVHDKEVFL